MLGMLEISRSRTEDFCREATSLHRITPSNDVATCFNIVAISFINQLSKRFISLVDDCQTVDNLAPAVFWSKSTEQASNGDAHGSTILEEGLS